MNVRIWLHIVEVWTPIVRTALLSAVKRTHTGSLRAGEVLFGRSILRWQSELAFALGCERIICICASTSDSIVQLQQEVESWGAEFHAIRNNLQMAGLVKADDEIVMLRDGLFVDAEAAAGFFIDDDKLHRRIATIPADSAQVADNPDDFERIDRETHWAGLAALSARQVHKIADFPPDSEAMSLLLRLALQDKVGRADWNGAVPRSSLILTTDPAALGVHEREWLQEHRETASLLGPFDWLAAQLANSVAPRGLSMGAELSAAASLALMLVAIGLSSLGLSLFGLFAAACGAFAVQFSRAMSDIRAKVWSRNAGNGANRLAIAMPIWVEIGVTGCLILALGIVGSVPLQIALPVLVFGIIRLASRTAQRSLARFWSDTTAIMVVLIIAMGTGYLLPTMAGLGLIALIDLRMRALKL